MVWPKYLAVLASLLHWQHRCVIVLKHDWDFQLFWLKFYSCTYILLFIYLFISSITTSLDLNMY